MLTTTTSKYGVCTETIGAFKNALLTDNLVMTHRPITRDLESYLYFANIPLLLENHISDPPLPKREFRTPKVGIKRFIEHSLLRTGEDLPPTDKYVKCNPLIRTGKSGICTFEKFAPAKYQESTADFKTFLQRNYDIKLVCKHTGACSILHQSILAMAANCFTYEYGFFMLLTGFGHPEASTFKRMWDTWVHRELSVKHAFEYHCEELGVKAKVPVPQQMYKTRTDFFNKSALIKRTMVEQYEEYNVLFGEQDGWYDIPLELQNSIAFSAIGFDLSDPTSVFEYHTEKAAKTMYKLYRKCYRLAKDLTDEDNSILNAEIRRLANYQAWFPDNVDVNHKVSFTGLDTLTSTIAAGLNAISTAAQPESPVHKIKDALLNFVSFIYIACTSTWIASLAAFNLLMSSLGVSLVTLPPFLMKYLQIVYDFMSTKMSKISKAKMQSGVEDLVEIIPSIGALFFTVLVALVSKNIPSTTGIDALIRRMKDIPNAFRGAYDIHQYFALQLSTVTDSVKCYLFGGERVKKIDPFQMINTWMNEVNEVCTLKNLNNLAFDTELVEKVARLHREGMELNQSFIQLRVPAKELTLFRNAQMSLNTAMIEARRSGAGGIGPREEPVLLHLYGASGVGKSTVTWPLIADFFIDKRGHTDPKTVYEATYFRKVGQEFWDGMTSQKEVIVYDDVGTLKDAVSKPNEEFLEAIHSSNIAPHPVHMASLHEKSNTFNKAKLIVWTSNRRTFDMPSLTNPEAVTRRIDLQIKVTPAPEFADGDKLDLNKIDIARKNNQNFDITTAYRFTRVNKDAPNEEPIGEPMTFEEFRTMFYGIYDFKIANSRSLIDSINKRMRERAVFQAAEFPNGKPNQNKELAYNRLRRIESGGELSRHVFNSKLGFDYLMRSMEYEALDKIANLSHVQKHFYRDCWNQGTLYPKYHITLKDYETDYTGHLPEIQVNWQTRIYKDRLKIREMKPLVVQNCCMMTGDIPEMVYALSLAERIGPALSDEANMDCDKIRRYIVDFVMADMGASGTVHECERDCEEALPMMSADIGTFVNKLNFYKPDFYNCLQIALPLIATVGGIIISFALAFGFETIQIKQREKHIRKMRAEQVESEVLKTVTLESTDLQSIAENHTLWTGVSRGSHDFVNATDEEPIGAVAKMEYRKEEVSTPKAKLEYDKENVSAPKAKLEYKEKDTSRPHAKLEAKLQGVVDSDCQDLIAKLAYNNMYRLEVFCNNAWKPLGTITFIRNRDALMNAHFLKSLYKFSKFRIWSLNCPTPVEADVSEILYTTCAALGGKTQYRDIAIVRFPRSFMPRTNILNAFVSAKEAGWITHVPKAYMVGPTNDSNKRMLMKFYCVSDVKAQDGFLEMENQDKIRQYYEYPIETVPGDCGALMLLSDPHKRGKIFSLHFAGRDKTYYSGIGAPLSRELIDKLLARLPSESDLSIPVSERKTIPIVVQDDEVPEATYNSGTIDYISPIKGEIIPLCLDNPVFCARNSTIIPSVLHGMREPTCAPAILKPYFKDGERVDPRITSLGKVGMPIVRMNDKNINDMICQDLYQLYTQVEPTTKRIFTLAESIRGAEDCGFFNAMCRSSSAGYGWKGKGKTTWLGQDENFIIDDPIVVEKTTERIYNAIEGRRTETIWVDTLKDERRPLAKVAEGKTRTFAVGPLDFNLVFRMYFGAFMNHVMENRIDNECCVGTNVYSADWDKIAHRLKKNGPRVVAGDFTNFDGTLNADILWSLLDVVNEWYDDDNKQIREILFCEIVHSVHTCDGLVYSWTHSQPSGNPMTVILNSMYNSYVMRYAYLQCAPAHMRNMLSFNQHVTMVNYGDDNVINMSGGVSDFYNQNTMTTALSKIGMIYTDEAKSTDVEDFRKLDQVSFLKRAFRFDEDRSRFVGPLSLTTIYEMMLWCRKGQDIHENTSVNVMTAMMEASFHPREVFDEVHSLVKKNVHRLRVQPKILTYDSYKTLDITEYILGSGMVDFSKPRMGLVVDDGSQPAAKPESGCTLSSHWSAEEGYLPPLTHVCLSKYRICVPSITERVESLVKSDVNKRLTNNSDKTIKAFFNSGLEGNINIATRNDQPETIIKQEIVNFADDGTQPNSAVADLVPSVPCAIKTASENKTHTVRSFVQRPVVIGTNVWSSDQAAKTLVASFDIPNALMAKPVIAEKLAGFTFFRGSTVFKIQVNATPFMQGRLIALFVPYGQSNRTAPTALDSLSGMTGYPHIDLDISTAQTMSLKIPFVSPLTHLDLVRGFGVIGQLRLYVYSPLASSEASSIDVTTWGWFEDVELEIPTGLPIQARMQSGEGDSNDVAEINVRVPFSWEKVAALGNGWEKATTTKIPMPMAPSLSRAFANGKGVDGSKTFSVAPVASIAPISGKFGTSKDEMMISYVAGTPTFCRKFQWPTSAAGLALLDAFPVHPMLHYNGDTTTNQVNPTLLSYVTAPFRYWSGSLIYSFKFVKTNFHSGRIRMIFVPGKVEADPRPIDVSKCYQQVFDLRERSEFEVRIPYVNHAPWQRVGTTSKWDFPSSINPYANGTIYMYVLNQLKAPGMTANNVECLIEIRGGDDYVVAGPDYFGAIPVTHTLAESKAKYQSDEENSECDFNAEAMYYTFDQESGTDEPTPFEVKKDPNCIQCKWNDSITVYPYDGDHYPTCTGNHPDYLSCYYFNKLCVSCAINSKPREYDRFIDVLRDCQTCVDVRNQKFNRKIKPVGVHVCFFHTKKSKIPHHPDFEKYPYAKYQGFEQVLTRDETQEGAEAVPLFDSPTLGNELCREKYCIGESVRSIKSLLSRFNPLNQLSVPVDNAVAVSPYYVNSNNGFTPSANSRLWNDYYSWFSFIYAFGCGGMRLKFIPERPQDTNLTYYTGLVVADSFVPTNAPSAAAATTAYNLDVTRLTTRPKQFHYPRTEGPIEVEVPQYLPTATFMTQGNFPVVGVAQDLSNAQFPSVTCFSTDAFFAYLYRAVADDFQFGFLVGAPSIVVNDHR